MTMFALENQPARVLNHNPRIQMQGKDRVLAGDLKLQVTVRASALAAFDPLFEQLLFRKSAPGDAELQKDLVDEADPEISRRLPQLGPLHWNEKFPGYTLEVVKGLGLEDPIVLPKRELSNFELEAQDGGLVQITFRCSGVLEENATSGNLDGLQQTEVEISLTPPTADAVATMKQQALDGVPRKNVLVVAIELDQSHSSHQFSAKCSLAGGDVERVGEWAYRPSLDEIALKLSDELDASIEFTPAVRNEYENAAEAVH